MSILGREFLGNELWKYGLFFLILLLAGFALLIIRKLWDLFLSRRRVPERVERALRGLSGRPLGALTFLLGLWTGVRVFSIPAAALGVVKGIFVVSVTLVAVYTLTKLLEVLFALWAEKAKGTETRLDDQVIPILSRVTKYFVWAVGILLALQNIGYNVTSLLAGLGIGGLAVALAAQDTLANFIGSLVLLVDRPCQVGDRVEVDGIEGWVEAIGLRSTRIRTLDGTLVSIPNRSLANARINNIAKRPTIKNVFTVGVTYDTSYEKMMKALEILREILANHPSTERYWAYFKEFGPYSLNILVVHWCRYLDYEEFLKATEEINLEIKRRFEEAGIQFAFPTQTIELKGIPAEVSSR